MAVEDRRRVTSRLSVLQYLITVVFSLLAVLAALMFALSFALKKNQVGGAHVVVE